MNTLVNQESAQVNKSYGVLHRMKLWTTAVFTFFESSSAQLRSNEDLERTKCSTANIHYGY